MLKSTLVIIAVFAASLSNGLREGNGDDILTVVILGNQFKADDGKDMPSATKGKLIAQLFDASGSGNPIWTEVTHDALAFPASNTTGFVITLGKVNAFPKDGQGVPISLKEHWLMLTTQSDNATYSTGKMQFRVREYAQKADFALDAEGKLKALLDSFQKRIEDLEKQLREKSDAQKKLQEGYVKLREATLGIAQTDPIENGAP